MDLTKAHLMEFGRLIALYSYRHSVFKPNAKKSKNKNTHTQFQRAMKTFDIELIHVKTPQAKGRVERTNKTLQDRLVKEMRLNNINTIEQANEFLVNFREDYNNKFAKAPQSQANEHR